MGILGNGKMSLLGDGRFANRPHEGLVTQHISGDHKGRPYGGQGGGLGMGDDGFFTPLRYVQNDMWVEGRVVREASVRGVGHAAYIGRPQGLVTTGDM